MPKPALDKFGEFVMRNLRDKAIDYHLLLQRGHWRAPALQELQAAVGSLPDETKQLLLRCVVDAVDTSIHDFLFALQESHDLSEGIEVITDGTNVAAISDGLHGEPYGDNGWIQRFSEFPDTHTNA